jgi:hypothetical protein
MPRVTCAANIFVSGDGDISVKHQWALTSRHKSARKINIVSNDYLLANAPLGAPWRRQQAAAAHLACATVHHHRVSVTAPGCNHRVRFLGAPLCMLHHAITLAHSWHVRIAAAAAARW